MPQTIKLALLDDYQKVAMRMADWDRLKKRGVEITVFHEPFSSVEDAAAEAGAVRDAGPAARAHGLPARADREAAQPQVHGADRRARLEPRRQGGDRARHPDQQHAGRRLQRLDGRALLGAADVVRPRPRQGRAPDAHRRLARRHRADAGARGQAAGRHRARPARQPRRGLRQGLRHGRRGLEPEPHARRRRPRAAPGSSARTSC